jgi:hypothetical protein
VLARIDKRRLTEERATVGDLGILILHELALTYREARKRLHACVDYWDLRFFRDHETDEPALIDLRALVGEFSKRVEGLNLPRSEVEHGWFSDVSLVKRAETVDELIDRTRHDLDALKETLRSSFEAVRLAHSERLQRGLERVTAILLVPTLIAGFYGANTALPGGNHWTGFVIMLALMALGAGTSYALLVRARRRRG